MEARIFATRVVATACALVMAACGRVPASEAASVAGPVSQNRQAEAALIALKNAVRDEPGSAQTRFQLGLALLEQGQAAQALIELERAAALGLPQSQAWPPIARTLLALGRAQQVIDRFKGTAWPTSESAADLQTSVAAAYADMGQRELAAAALQQALRLSPSFTPALLFQVRLLAASGDIQTAQGQLENLLASEPQNAWAWQLQGDLLERQGANAQAAALAYRRSITLRPDRVPAHAGLVTALLRAGDVTGARQQADAMQVALPADPQTAFALAQVALAEGNPKLAHALSMTALRGMSDDARLLQFAGLTALQMGAPLDAEGPLLKSLQQAPQAPLTRHLLASVYLATQQPGKLEAVLEPLLQHADPQALLQQAQARRPAGQPPASSPLPRTTDGPPRGPDEAPLQVEAMIASRQFEAARQALDALEVRQPAQPVAAFLRGRLRLAQRDLVGARAAFEQAQAVSPDHGPSGLALAALDAQAGKPALAEARLQALLRRHAGDPALRLAYAGLLQSLGKGQAAEVVLQDGATAMSGNADLLDALARLQLRERHFGQALRTLSKLAALRPRAADVPLRVAEAQMGLGDTAQVREALQRALVLHPSLLQAQRGLVSLALLEGQPQAALALARQVQQQPGGLGLGLLLEGDVQVASGDVGGAVSAYLDGLRRAPSTELAAKAHAALMAQGQREAANRVAADWLRSHPRDADFALHLGNGALARGDAAAAERQFQQAVRLQPLSGMALNNLAMAMLQLGHTGALDHAERAAALLPGSAEVADTLAAARRAERPAAWAATRSTPNGR